MSKLYGYVKKDLDKYAKICEITTDSGGDGVTDLGVPSAPTLTPITTDIHFLPIDYNDFCSSIGTEFSLNNYVNAQTGVIDTSFHSIQSDGGEYGIGLGLYLYYKSGVTEQQKQDHYESLSRTYQNGFITNNGQGDTSHSVYKTQITYNSSVNTYHLATSLNFPSGSEFTTSIPSNSLKLSSDIINLANDPLIDDIFIDIFKVRLNPLVKTILNSNNDNVAIIGVANKTVNNSDGMIKANEVEKRFSIDVDILDNTKINIRLYAPTINDKIQYHIPNNTFLLYSLY